MTVAPATQPVVQQTAPGTTPQYTGEIATFDLVDYPLKDFFRLISEISGLNVVLDPNVNGTVTLKLTDVPWDQALDVVLKNYQLGGQLQGNVLRIATNGTLQAEQAQQKALRDAQELAAPLETRTNILNYTTADAISTTLKSLTTTRGNIIVDARRNAVIVSDIPNQFGKLDSMIHFLDTAQQQVDIEARLLQANKSFSRDIGNQLGLLFGANNGNVVTGLSGAGSPFGRTPLPRAPGLTLGSGPGIPLVSNLPAAATSGLSFLIQPGGDVFCSMKSSLRLKPEVRRGSSRVLMLRRKITSADHPTGNADSGSNQRQQHYYGAVYEFRPAADRHTANQCRRNDPSQGTDNEQPTGLCASG